MLTLLNTSLVATVSVVASEKSVTSALIVTEDGISISVPSLSARLSERPGSAKPATTVLSPSSMTLPLSTVIFLKLSLSRIIPLIIRNGTYISSFLPSISTVFLQLLT